MTKEWTIQAGWCDSEETDDACTTTPPPAAPKKDGKRQGVGVLDGNERAMLLWGIIIAVVVLVLFLGFCCFVCCLQGEDGRRQRRISQWRMEQQVFNEVQKDRE